MFSDSKIQGLFPTNLWVNDLEPERAETLNRSLTATLQELMKGGPPIRPDETWQSDQNLHRLPDFAELMSVVDAALTNVLDSLEVIHSGFRITGCWANLGPPSAGHQGHTHPNNYLSGVYYVRTPEGATGINFHDPRPQVDIISPAVRRRNQYNSAIVTVPVRAGRLIVFPAWLGHSVFPNRSREVRISISFNMMFDAFAETIAAPKWLSSPGRDPSRS